MSGAIFISGRAQATADAVPMFLSRRRLPAEPLRPGELAIRRAILIFHVTRAELLGSRLAHAVEARAWVAAELRGQGWSLTRIGRFLGRDHTSIMAALRRHAARVAGGASR